MRTESDMTEHEIAIYLLNHPEFFEQHAETLARIQLTSPHGQRAVSLQERQMELLREKIKGLELKMAELLRYGQENDAIANKLNHWARDLMLTRQSANLPALVVDGLRESFSVPFVGLRLWGLTEANANLREVAPFAQLVSLDITTFANSLMAPFCGKNTDYEAVRWLPEPAAVNSVAMIPLRIGAHPEAFGMVVLGSPDERRFYEGMGTTFLAQIGEFASAALSRLLP